MRFGLILLVLLFAVAGAVFGSLNGQAIDLDFYFGQVVLGKGAALLCALLAGWLLGGLLVYLGLVVPLRRRLRRQTRQLRQLEPAAVPSDVAGAPPERRP
ncbi:MAG TPA: lipopolysaccharide assembly protein LapA domain-containing protein [Rudaea sp.]|nr:lipopolysaccharide assembly protein LapA domain-containing protein [Rudaea sp.]